jgi:hypothetical protein
MDRRYSDLGQRCRSRKGPPGAPGRRGDRVRRFTRAGVAAALAVLSRQGGLVPPERDRAHVEVESGDFRVTEYDRGDLDALIDEAAAAYGISAHLVRAVAEAESGFDPGAVSPAGAQGLMQLMPATAALMGVDDRLDPRQSAFGGAKYLSQLLDRFDGDVALALASYNAGPTRVARYRGIPPYGETRRYVAKIRVLLAETSGALFPLPKPALTRSLRKPVVARSVRGPGVRRAAAGRVRQGHANRRASPPGRNRRG